MERADMLAEDLPQGITRQHIAQTGPPWLQTMSAFIVFGAVVAFGLSSMAGGYPHPRIGANAPEAVLVVESPARIRNGEFFEIRFSITARQPISDATLAISNSYLRDITINTMLPGAEKEESKDGSYRLSFGPLAPGDSLHFKMDGQINPSMFGGTHGQISLLDGETPLARLPVSMTVLP
jgi:hypothetical protein